jgi:argininosuccinate lyase
MPQKKNPDALELLRGKAGPAVGNLISVFVIFFFFFFFHKKKKKIKKKNCD